VRGKSALALRFSTIFIRMYSGSESDVDGAEKVFVDDQASFCITLVRLLTAKSLSSGVFNFMFSFISALTN